MLAPTGALILSETARRGGSVWLNSFWVAVEWMPACLCRGQDWLRRGEVCLIGGLAAKR